jgi:branched-chain amino acid transport system ATP-binding protein
LSLLEIRGLKVAYGGIEAVRGIDLHVAEGELVALIGANGAGKTTTLKAIAGMLRPAAGTLRYNGDDVTGLPSHVLIRRGIALVPEGRGVFARLTVEENLAMGAYIREDRPAVRADTERVFDLFPRLRERRAQVAGTLSGGEQQMLAIGRAMMSRPRLLLLDEPSMGLAPLMVQKIFEVIRSIAAQGVTILLVEQNALLALEAAARGYVMESGALTLQNTGAALLASPQVRQAYLGE